MVIAEDEQGVQLEKPMEISVRVQDENDNGPLCDEAVFEVQENEPSGKNPHHLHKNCINIKSSFARIMQISIRSMQSI